MEKIPRKEFLNNVEVEGCDIILKACFDKQKNGSYNMESNLVSNSGMLLDEYEISNLICAAMASRFANVIELTNEDEFIERMVDVFAKYLKELVQNMAIQRASKKADKFVEMCKRVVSENACDEWKEKGLIEAYEEKRKLLETKIVDLKLSNRIKSKLWNARIKNVRDLVSYNKDTIKIFGSIGDKSVKDIEECLESYGLHLGMSSKDVTKWIKTNK